MAASKSNDNNESKQGPVKANTKLWLPVMDTLTNAVVFIEKPNYYNFQCGV